MLGRVLTVGCRPGENGEECENAQPELCGQQELMELAVVRSEENGIDAAFNTHLLCSCLLCGPGHSGLLFVLIALVLFGVTGRPVLQISATACSVFLLLLFRLEKLLFEYSSSTSRFCPSSSDSAGLVCTAHC